MLTLLDPDIQHYAHEHTTPSGALFDELRKVTLADTELPQMQVGRIEGQLLTLLARLAQAKNAVEIGTFTGYSSLHIAMGLSDDGTLITCDIDEDTTAIARKFWAQSPAGKKIQLRLGPALDTLKTINGPLDLAFIDADKENYTNYWEALVPKMRPGGVIIADNVLWSGKVLNPQESSDKAIVEFNTHVANDSRVEQVMLSVRDGITLARVL
jgi:caffeoyl-CoA O-methyltransferase